jgi:hypothetical protein
VNEFVWPVRDREQDVENLYGIRREVADLSGTTFERMDFEGAAGFAVASIEAIPVGMVYPDPYGEVGLLGPRSAEKVLEFLRTGVLV